jgi:hypothetical protein
VVINQYVQQVAYHGTEQGFKSTISMVAALAMDSSAVLFALCLTYD